MLATSHSGTASQAKTAPKLLSTQNLANSEKEFDDEEDEDFDVRLDQPEADEARSLTRSHNRRFSRSPVRELS